MNELRMTPYDVMGISEDSSEEYIENRFRELAKEFHPDISEKENTVDKFNDIHRAKELLTNQNKRNKIQDFNEYNYFWRNGSPVTRMNKEISEKLKENTKTEREKEKEYRQKVQRKQRKHINISEEIGKERRKRYERMKGHSKEREIDFTPVKNRNARRLVIIFLLSTAAIISVIHFNLSLLFLPLLVILAMYSIIGLFFDISS